MSEIEETLKRINSHKGVLGILIANGEGVTIRSTFDKNQSEQLSSLFGHMVYHARNCVRGQDPTDDLKIVRVRSSKQEFLIVPGEGFFLLVAQAATSTDDTK